MANRKNIPEHLPDRLAVSMWDHSWYNMCHPDEVFGDLERAMDELMGRGFNAIRACGMANCIYYHDGARRKFVELTNTSDGRG